MAVRSPIVCVLGHVDHGKTSLLDAIRGSAVAAKEAGAITQMIGASYLPREAIERTSAPVADLLKIKIEIPGLLFIDTPGHEAFTNLRERGGSIADMAILVVDVAQGFQPQTLESIRILKQCRTPFVVAANKIDLIHGWKKQGTDSFLKSFAKQPPHVQEAVDNRMYELMGALSTHGFDCDRFDRITDFKKQIAIIPLSAKTREGLAELLLLIAGLSQKFMEKRLELGTGEGKGTVLEVKEEKGLGSTVDIVLYDGKIAKGDEIIFLARDGVRRTKVRALLEPNLAKGAKDKYAYLDSIEAAAGVKILAPDLGGVIPGSPLYVVKDFEAQKAELEAQAKQLLFESGEEGVIVKADSLGSIEAILALFTKNGIKVRKADIGAVTRMDVAAAKAVRGENRYDGVVFGFNVEVMDEARAEAEAAGVPIIWSNVIYKFIEDYEEWRVGEKGREKKELEAELPWPAKIKVLKGFFFRLSKPAVFGIEVMGGKLRKGVRLMNASGADLGEVKGIQNEGKGIEEAAAGLKVAISSEDIVLGKDVKEGDVLYTAMGKSQVFKWEEKGESLDEGGKEVLEEIKKIVVYK
ncbi:MAG: translation initiation factor IF-2 [Candidatus Micrarchaeia archaeon]|jgi:translation initiation factor 5B